MTLESARFQLLWKETGSTIQSNFKLQNWSEIEDAVNEVQVPYLDGDNQRYECKNRNELTKRHDRRQLAVGHSESQTKCK